MKKLFLLFFCLLLAKITFAQTPQTELKRTVFEPPKTVNGFKVRWATLSKGKYQGVFTNDTIQQIGCIYFNRITGEVVGEVEKDSLYFPASVSSRWWSVDPLAAKYPELCPYVFVANNPIIFIDPDGRDIFPAGLNGTSYQKIFEGMQGNSIYQKYSKNFNNQGQDLYLNYSKPKGLENHTFSGIFGRTFTTKPNSFAEMTAYFIPTTDIQEQIVGNMINKREVSDIHKATVFIHEILHAYVRNSDTEREKLSKEMGGQFTEKDEHEYVANHFVGEIEASIREFANQNNIKGLDNADYKALSWVGLRQTKAFTTMWNNMSKVEQEKMTTTYNKLLYSKTETTDNVPTKVVEKITGKGNITEE